MDDKIIATFCLCDDLLKAIHHQEERQCQMNDAEIMTTAFVASLFFRGNHESARAMLQQHGYIPRMLSKSRFSRRLHRIKDIFVILFDLLGQTWKTLNTASIYVIDSLPIAVCDNIRIRRSKIYSDENFRGYAHNALRADISVRGWWHSNENAVRFWIPSPRVPKETDARCYACTTAYALMIPRCNVC